MQRARAAARMNVQELKGLSPNISTESTSSKRRISSRRRPALATAVLQTVHAQAYAPCSLRIYDRAAAIFCSEVARHCLQSDQLVGVTFTKVCSAAFGRMHSNKYDERRLCLDRFISALVEAGVAQPPKASIPIER